jgi:Rap1a immunity proteins
MKIIFGLVLLTLFAVPSRAQSTITDGNHLLVSCQITVKSMDNGNTPATNTYDNWRDGLCVGLVRAVLHISPSICSANITAGQAIRVVEKYLRDHPERLSLGDIALIDEALSQAFPCKQS